MSDPYPKSPTGRLSRWAQNREHALVVERHQARLEQFRLRKLLMAIEERLKAESARTPLLEELLLLARQWEPPNELGRPGETPRTPPVEER